MTCPVCDGTEVAASKAVPDVARIRPEGFVLKVCTTCGAGRVEPELSDDELLAYYPEAFYGTPSRASRLLTDAFLRLRARVVLGAVERPGRLLDVGSGAGDFLGEMQRRGFEVAGVEPSEGGRRRARHHTDALFASLADVGDRTFDVVTAWQSVEHMRDPSSAIRTLRTMLAPGGLLVVAVPNFASPEARLGGSAWFHLDVPRHQIHFTPKALRTLLERGGFKVEQVRFFSPEYNPFGLLQTLQNLLPIEHNALYQAAKHGRATRTFAPGTRAVVRASLMALPFTGPASVAYDALSASFGTGGTMTALARPV